MNKQDAERLNEHLERIKDHANHVLFIANNSDDKDMKNCVAKVMATVLAELHLELLVPLYKQFPELRPEGL
jgi:hypothetical protein